MGGITYDDNGNILSAKAIELKIIGKQNGTAAKLNHINSQNAIGEYVSLISFFNKFLKKILGGL